MDDGASWFMGSAIFILLLILEGIASSFVSAMENVGESQVEKISGDNHRKLKHLKWYYDHQTHYIHILQMMTVLTGGLSVIIQLHLWNQKMTVTNMYQRAGISVLIFIVTVLVFLALAVFMPWNVGERKVEKTLGRFCGFFYGYDVVLCPLLKSAIEISHLFARIFGVDPNMDMDDVTEEEIISMVNEGHEQGVLLASEAAMIQNIFEFGDKNAKDIMVHRKNVIGMSGELTLQEAIVFMNDHSFSRYPVYEDNLDNILGILHIKDVMMYIESGHFIDQKICDIDGLIRPAEYVPETHGINTLFTKMQSDKKHMVIIVDEYGQTSGIISMEDILEEIVGNIQDEHDEEEDTIEKVTENHFIMEGRTPLDEVEEILGISFEDEDVETLNGFLISQIDKIPQDHEVFTVRTKGYEFSVLDVVNKMIQNVQVKRIEENEGELETEDKK